MKRIIKALSALFLMSLSFTLINVNAETDKVIAIEGASIRAKTENALQGLRFYAKLDESVKDNVHGFYLVYGEATLANLKDVIDDETPMLNDKVVFNVVVNGVTNENEFSVVLTKIPTHGYFDKISVFPYVVIDDEVVFSSDHTTRSVGEVALNMVGQEQIATDVLKEVEDDFVKTKLNQDLSMEVSVGFKDNGQYISYYDYDFYYVEDNFTLPNISKEDNTFVGWYLNENLLEDYITEVKKDDLTNSLTLYPFLYNDLEETYSGNILKIAYKNSVSLGATTDIDAVYLQDPVTGKLFIVTGLEEVVGLKEGSLVEFTGLMEKDNFGRISISYKSDFTVLEENATLLDYKDTAITVNSHQELIDYLSKDFHFGQVYKLAAPIYFNSTTSSGDITHIRYHLNPNANALNNIRYGSKNIALTFNVVTHQQIYDPNFTHLYFGQSSNPGTTYPGIELMEDLYVTFKDFSDTYYYTVLLNGDDFINPIEDLVEEDIKNTVPTELLVGDLDLPTTHYLLSSPITWVSDNENIIDNTGKVTYTQDEETVELTFSFDHNGQSYSYAIEVTVKAAEPMTVNEIIDEASHDDIVYVEAIVVGFHWNGSSTVNAASNGIIIKDATGNEILYVIGLYGNYGSIIAQYTVGDDTLAKGDKIRFVANYEISTTEGHAGRKTLVIDTAESANLRIIEREVAYTFELNEAVEITDQNDLEDFVQNLEYGKLFKITGDFGFRGSASSYGTGVNLQTSYVRGAAGDYTISNTWDDGRGQRLSFKFDGNVPNLGAKWYEDLLGINSETYTGTAASGMTFEEGTYIYFYIGHALPRATGAHGYIQAAILEVDWVNGVLK